MVERQFLTEEVKSKMRQAYNIVIYCILFWAPRRQCLLTCFHPQTWDYFF